MIKFSITRKNWRSSKSKLSNIKRFKKRKLKKFQLKVLLLKMVFMGSLKVWIEKELLWFHFTSQIISSLVMAIASLEWSINRNSLWSTVIILWLKMLNTFFLHMRSMSISNNSFQSLSMWMESHIDYRMTKSLTLKSHLTNKKSNKKNKSHQALSSTTLQNIKKRRDKKKFLFSK